MRHKTEALVRAGIPNMLFPGRIGIIADFVALEWFQVYNGKIGIFERIDHGIVNSGKLSPTF